MENPKVDGNIAQYQSSYTRILLDEFQKSAKKLKINPQVLFNHDTAESLKAFELIQEIKDSYPWDKHLMNQKRISALIVNSTLEPGSCKLMDELKEHNLRPTYSPTHEFTSSYNPVNANHVFQLNVDIKSAKITDEELTQIGLANRKGKVISLNSDGLIIVKDNERLIAQNAHKSFWRPTRA